MTPASAFESHSSRSCRTFLFSILLVILAGAAPRPASGQPFYPLLSNNSRLDINLAPWPTVHNTVFNWVVENGTINQKDHLEEFSNWFRVGNTPELPVSALPVQVNSVTSNQLAVTHQHPLFSLQITYNVSGGPIGSGYSEMGECVTIKNLDPLQQLDLHFFEYMNLDLDETPSDDTAVRLNASRLKQSDTITGTYFEVAYGTSSRHEIAYHPATLTKLNTGGASNLNNVPAGFNTTIGPPHYGNMTWALQWDLLLDPDDGFPGGSDEFTICKDCKLQMNFIPEPGSWVLAAICAMALLRVRAASRPGRGC